MTNDASNLAVLFADISGSTRLYETVGDANALATIGRCLALVRLACCDCGLAFSGFFSAGFCAALGAADAAG